MNQQIQLAEGSLASVTSQISGYEHTAQGTALAFAEHVRGRLLYVSEDRSWSAWDGCRWNAANGHTILQMLWDQFVGCFAQACVGVHGKDLDAKLERLTAVSSPRAFKDTLALLPAKLAVSREAFDRNANHLLVTPSGTVNLRTGVLGPNDPGQLLTQCTAVPYAQDAPTPQRFAELVCKLAGDDPDTILWLWRAIGYTLTGEVHEDAVFYLRGPGGNGKSTLIKALFSILGNYAAKLDIRVLATGSEYHDTELAHLRGKRFVQSSEIAKGMQLREDTLKDLSGGEAQTPREIQQRKEAAAVWVPSCKLWLYGNYDLSIRGTDDGIWRRINKIESAHKFPKSGIRDSLTEHEGTGILGLAVAAAVDWYVHGLGARPGRVEAATAAYRSQQDVLGQFFDERLVFNKEGFVASSALRIAYGAWCTERDYDFKVGPKDFEARLRDRGCTEARVRTGAGQLRGWQGVQFLGIQAH